MKHLIGLLMSMIIAYFIYRDSWLQSTANIFLGFLIGGIIGEYVVYFYEKFTEK